MLQFIHLLLVYFCIERENRYIDIYLNILFLFKQEKLSAFKSYFCRRKPEKKKSFGKKI